MDEQLPQEKYGMLRGIAALLTLAGGGIMAIGVLAVAYVIWGPQTITSIPTAIAGVAVIPLGLLLLAASESIHVLLDTEANTRRTGEAMITLIADVRDLKEILNRMDFYLQRSTNATEKLAGVVAPPAIKSR